ncbi:MAG: D-alanine--D-alanine ligase [Deltaproteobacteria bacterium]|nr:D-alanine--D-alanine ligase [Deltaproteobacteria bacterium]
MTTTRIALLYGGRSAEHDISILSARTVVAALDPARFTPVPVYLARDGRMLLQSAERLLSAADPSTTALVPLSAAELARAGGEPVDVVFPVLHGPYGEDGTVQGLLELAGIPYVGAGVLGSAVGMDKDVMKRLLRDAGLAVADFRALRRGDGPAVAAEVGFPLFVKPANLGSSVGVRRVARAEELEDALQYAFEFDDKVLAEAEVRGLEVECAVLGNERPRASVVGAIRVTHADGFYSYDAKYLDEHGAALEIPARISATAAARVRAMAVEVYRTLECAGLARVDFFLRDDGHPVVNEINTLPGFTAHSMVPLLWQATGMSTRELVTELLDLAVERHRRRRLLRHTR